MGIICMCHIYFKQNLAVQLFYSKSFVEKNYIKKTCMYNNFIDMVVNSNDFS